MYSQYTSFMTVYVHVKVSSERKWIILLRWSNCAPVKDICECPARSYQKGFHLFCGKALFHSAKKSPIYSLTLYCSICERYYSIGAIKRPHCLWAQWVISRKRLIWINITCFVNVVFCAIKSARSVGRDKVRIKWVVMKWCGWLDCFVST